MDRARRPTRPRHLEVCLQSAFSYCSAPDWGKAFGWDVVHEVLVYIIEAFVALILITFAYQFASLAWKGRTVGIVIRVCPMTESPNGLSKWDSARRAFGSTM